MASNRYFKDTSDGRSGKETLDNSDKDKAAGSGKPKPNLVISVPITTPNTPQTAKPPRTPVPQSGNKRKAVDAGNTQ